MNSHTQFLKSLKDQGLEGQDFINQYKGFLTNPDNADKPFDAQAIYSQVQLFKQLKSIGMDETSREFNFVFMHHAERFTLKTQQDA